MYNIEKEKEVVALSAEIDYSKIGMRIRLIRKERKLTQEEVATACGCTSNHLSAVETGTHKPSLDLIIKLATVLDSSVDYFLMDTIHANQQYFINSRIAPKLDGCSAYELQYIERVIDELLIYRNGLLSSK